MRGVTTLTLATGILALCSGLPARADTLTFIDLAAYANNNIYTDLNQNFPNTGAGTPGTHTGVANATYTFSPWSYTPPAAATATTVAAPTATSAPLGNTGISFQLNSNTAGQDFAQIGQAGSGQTAYNVPGPLTVAINQSNVTTVYALMSAYDGQSFSITFTGAGGETQMFNSVSLPDFNGGNPVNDCVTVAGACIQTVYTVTDQGAGGTGNSQTGDTARYDLTQVSFTLDAALAADFLDSATITSNGFETLLFGLTTDSASETTTPLPAALPLFATGLGGLGFFGWRRKRKAQAVA